MNIAVLGAGIAGLACASSLHKSGHAVTVYEKSRGVGGRMSTRVSELGGFDHGAQYFTTTSEEFRKQTAIWRREGKVEPWAARLATLAHGVATAATKPAREHPSRRQRFVAVPGMHSLGKHLAQNLDVRLEQQVECLEPHGNQWLLKVRCDTVPIPATAGPFDAVVLAVPADQAAPLLAVVPQMAAQAHSARLAPCWTMMLAFDRPLDLPYDGAWVEESRLGWIARDTSKPQRRPGEHWIANATQAWSIEHLEEDAERAKEKLLRAFHEATGSQVQPVHVAMHRWRYAQAVRPLSGDCLYDASRRIAACGDWFSAGLDGAGRVENAWLSGIAAAARIG